MESEEIKTTIYGLQFLKEKLYNGIFSDRLDCIDYAINALKEVQQYREIGTVEECREAREKQIPKECIVDSCPDHTHRVSEIKLRPCPFCGGEAHIDCFPGLDRPYLPVCNNEMCIACDTIVTFLTEKDAAEAWNRRNRHYNGEISNTGRCWESVL